MRGRGRQLSVWAFGLVLALWLPTGVAAMDIVDLQPTFSTSVVPTDTPVIVVFDQSVLRESITADSFFVSSWAGDAVISGSFHFAETIVPDDTVVFTPTHPWPFGERLRVTISDDATSTNLDPFTGVVPGDGLFVANIPNDFQLPVWNPADPSSAFTDTLDLLGYDPTDPQGDPEPQRVPGSFATEAWKYSTGRFDVVIAVIDTGVMPQREDTRTALFINRGELPLPNANGTPCIADDCNGDGRFNVEDYALDSRVSHSGPVNVEDLIAAFSDGVDDDANGYVDDISGWDFLRNTNEPWCANEIPTSCHGALQASTAADRADNGLGGRPGVCPGCSVLPLRTTAMILHGGAEEAAAIRYASSMGATVINISGVTLTWSEDMEQAIREANDDGTLLVAVSGDEMTDHHWMPAAGENAFSVKTIFPMVPVDLNGGFSLERFAYTETFATNYGPHIHLSIPTYTNSTSESASNTSGAVGLIQSRARDLGLGLSADEVKQILIASADDIADHCASVAHGLDVCQPGFDEHFGYGRMNLRRAMEMLGDADRGVSAAIPPSVRLVRPEWWQTVDPTVETTIDLDAEIGSRVLPYKWVVDIAEGQQPLESEFRVVASGIKNAAFSGTLATLDPLDFFSREWASGVPENKHSFEVTLRVRAFYDGAIDTVSGEDRKTISVHIDRDPSTGLMDGFPVDLGASGESAPILYDLDGAADNRLEIVVGTGAGTVEALKYSERSGTWAPMPGFPVDLSESGQPAKDAIFASLAVGDLFGDGAPEIVAATTLGSIYVIDPASASEGRPILDGYPVSTDPPSQTTPFEFAFGAGFLASPVLADLDADGVLDIIAAAMDQNVYAWKPNGQDDRPERLPGWPVRCRSDAGLVPDELVCAGESYPSPVLATPAVGILDPQNPDPDIRSRPAVIVSANEGCPGNESSATRVYAVFADGMQQSDGPFLPGWPAAPDAPFSEALQALPLIAGSAVNPAVFVDGDGAHVIVGATGWFPQILHYADDSVSVERIRGNLALNAVGSPAVTSLRSDGEKHILMPLVGMLRFDELGFELIDAALYGFDASSPRRTVMKRQLEDLPFLTSPVTADVDGDGVLEALIGTGGYLIHAFRLDGGEPSGWPKFTHKWLGTPVAGDIDNDGRLEIVVMSREGTLYAWETDGPACDNEGLRSDWRRYHHDERNTGFYGTDTVPPSGAVDFRAQWTASGGVRLNLTAPGDDWACGRAAAYDVRYTADANADLTDPETFAGAPVAVSPPPSSGGTLQSFVVEAGGAARIAIAASDGDGNRSRIVAVAIEDSADDDLSDDDAADDTEDDDGADDDGADDDGAGDDSDVMNDSDRESACGC